tara:strand:- start:178 stop:1134 length:957 start_codon:yes stop_codon:yes gene_type:complete
MSPNIRLGLIGAGKWGENYIKTIESIKNIELIRIACKSSISDKRIIFPSHSFTENWEEVVSSKEIDGIIIATPPKMHFEIASECIKNRKPLIVEKPFTLCLKDAEYLMLLAEKYKTIVKINHIYLYHPVFRLLKKEISKKSNLRSIYSVSGNFGPFRKDVSPLWDWGPHDVAMCLAIINKFPYKIESRYLKNDISSLNHKSNINIKLHFGKGIYADLNFGNYMKSKNRHLKVNFEDSSLIFDPIHYSNIQKEINEKINDYIYDKSNIHSDFDLSPLELLLKEFVADILSSNFNLSDLLLSKDVISILESVDQKLKKSF